jgi:class 3 adenylate cyclase
MTIGLLADLRDALPDISAPTLILHRKGVYLPVGLSRYLASHIAGARLVELEGADSVPYAGDADALLDEVEDFLTGSRTVRAGSLLATVLFTDIVSSTEQLTRVGDRAWRELLDRHDVVIADQLRRFGGRKVNSTGDGVVAVFERPTVAIRCAEAVIREAGLLGIDVRAGLHTGEIETRGDDVAGIAFT